MATVIYSEVLRTTCNSKATEFKISRDTLCHSRCN